MEIFRDINGYEGLYMISDKGNVRSLITNKTMILRVNRAGYLQVCLCKKGTKKWFLVHRLVAEAFVDNPNNYPCVNHINEDKTNNNASNLEWCTYKYNSNYGKNATIRNTRVNQYDSANNFIREWRSIKDAAEFFGIKYQGISRVCRGLRKTCGGFHWEYAR